ncbi:formate dehydrogenase accessory sulfurtransferase FdhD [Salipaludibacillus sp. CUR1]|uniref:formate dehydrogenase accessory sulfurtransferase FdhD n=1 Tax=Salipaludibacillus sp. CUR1 TaxID=2820003 RepID=UPI001E5189B1|nr:formate dehydrogenase accessory sulfurtransferase FdhD [Salipaludibacillus sp. CUR1]MCE7791482.1 formate dehydrogenase accessory sulfurtransferase FdhD [Salipaludibacillus sp. CUR1]
MRKFCPEEYPVAMFVNGEELAVYQLTKENIMEWAYGHLFTEGIIEKAEDVKEVRLSEGKVAITLTPSVDYEKMKLRKKRMTAGCGNGVTFFSMADVKSFPKVETTHRLSLTYLLKKRHEFAKASPMYNETGGMHGACIVFPDGRIIVREDIGRHNAVDKMIGHALLNRLDAKELILLTTGRISYEMLSKSARFGFGVVGSRTAATKQAVQLANFLGVEVVGYIRGKMSFVYTSHGKVFNDLEAVSYQ